jgi:hypothetical protein
MMEDGMISKRKDGLETARGQEIYISVEEDWVSGLRSDLPPPSSVVDPILEPTPESQMIHNAGSQMFERM